MTTLSELPFALQPLFSATEEGNTWLTSSPEDKQRQDVLWVLLAKDKNPEQPSTWLEISITPQNYPAIGIGRIDETLSQMQNHNELLSTASLS